MAHRETWQTGLRKVWQRRGWPARLLWPLSALYRLLWGFHQWRHRVGPQTSALPVPLVVVGNVVVGGAGKTPTTIALVRHWQRQGRRPGVISKGHGRQRPPRSHDHPVLVSADSPAARVGDEPLLIHQTTAVPVVVGPNRVASAQHLLAQHPDLDILICDDGLQDPSLRPQVRVFVFDDRGVGNGWLLPAGMLRQPWPVPCAPSDVALLAPSTRLDPAAGGPALPPGMPLFRAERRLGDVARDAQGRQAPLESLFDESPAHALAGIARPEAFFDMLRARGTRLVHTWALNDHQAIDNDFCSKLCSQIKREKVFLTEKDAVKLFPLLAATSAAAGEVSGSALQAWAVPLEFKPEPGFFAAIDARLSSPHGP